MNMSEDFDRLAARQAKEVSEENPETVDGMTIIGTRCPVNGEETVSIVIGDGNFSGVGIVQGSVEGFDPQDVDNLVLIPLDKVDEFKAAIDKTVANQVVIS